MHIYFYLLFVCIDYGFLPTFANCPKLTLAARTKVAQFNDNHHHHSPKTTIDNAIPPMLKYVNTGIVFSEIPDETTLAINLSNCPCRCPGCHSAYLWEDIGTPLMPDSLDALVKKVEADITCVAFMGGDADPMAVAALARHLRQAHPALRRAWYSGRIRMPRNFEKTLFHYIKLGPYIKHLGPLTSPTTNQHLYKQTSDGNFEDITQCLWKK